jgi:hypothetical protein
MSEVLCQIETLASNWLSLRHSPEFFNALGMLDTRAGMFMNFQWDEKVLDEQNMPPAMLMTAKKDDQKEKWFYINEVPDVPGARIVTSKFIWDTLAKLQRMSMVVTEHESVKTVRCGAVIPAEHALSKSASWDRYAKWVSTLIGRVLPDQEMTQIYGKYLKCAMKPGDTDVYAKINPGQKPTLEQIWRVSKSDEEIDHIAWMSGRFDRMRDGVTWITNPLAYQQHQQPRPDGVPLQVPTPGKHPPNSQIKVPSLESNLALLWVLSNTIRDHCGLSQDWQEFFVALQDSERAWHVKATMSGYPKIIHSFNSFHVYVKIDGTWKFVHTESAHRAVYVWLYFIWKNRQSLLFGKHSIRDIVRALFEDVESDRSYLPRKQSSSIKRMVFPSAPSR